MPPIAAPEVVPAPRLIVPSASLIVGADVVDHTAGDVRWLAGYKWAPLSCAEPDVWIENCTVVPMAKGTGRNRPDPGSAEPFMVVARDACSTWGYQTADYEGRARAVLAAREPFAVERELWAGAVIPANANLAQPDATLVNGGAALGYRDALTRLAQALADAKVGVGIIHARPGLVEQWWGAGLLREVQGKLRTATGHFVVAGYGYPGTGPNGEAASATQEWAYATDMIVVHRGPVEITPPLEADEATAAATQIADARRRQLQQATNTRTNDVTFYAERPYGIVWSRCAHLAVLVNTQASGAGGSSTSVVSGTVTATSPGGTAFDFDDVAVDGTVGGITLLAANPNRQSALVQNTGGADMRVTTDGSAPTATHGKLVRAADALVLSAPYCPRQAVKAIRVSGVSTTANASEVTG